MRRSLVVANWKMNGSLTDNSQLLKAFLASWLGDHSAQVAVCPPSIYLPQVTELLAQSGVELGSQDVSRAPSGAYTGEISAAMLVEFNCQFAIIGHSERRQYHGETDSVVAEKFVAAQNSGLTPILCVGETLEQRDSGQALVVIESQLKTVVDRVGLNAFTDAVVAYEPVWAIGTGRTATPEQAQEVHAFIRKQLAQMGSVVRVLYGGSVKSGNAEELFAQQDIDGALVGGASLDSNDFYGICQAADQ